MNRYGKYVFYAGNNTDAKFRLFCFPYAGGGASTYAKWKNYFDQKLVQVIPIQLPGRENRYEENEYDLNLEIMAKEVAYNIQAYADRPFAIFGHSMGGGFAYEFAKELKQKYGKTSQYLFVSGTAAPHKLYDYLGIEKNLSEKQFMTLLEHYNGMNPESMKIPQFFEYFKPIIKRDFLTIGGYQVKEKFVIDIPIHLFYGKSDPDMTEQNILPWQEYTNKEYTKMEFEGGHFFIKEHSQEMCAYMEQCLINIMD